MNNIVNVKSRLDCQWIFFALPIRLNYAGNGAEPVSVLHFQRGASSLLGQTSRPHGNKAGRRLALAGLRLRVGGAP